PSCSPLFPYTTLFRSPAVPAAVDVQQHAGQRPPWTPLAMHPALAPPGHQSRPLQCLLHPAVAEFNPMLIAELLMKMPHVQIVIADRKSTRLNSSHVAI